MNEETTTIRIGGKRVVFVFSHYGQGSVLRAVETGSKEQPAPARPLLLAYSTPGSGRTTVFKIRDLPGSHGWKR